MDWIRILLSRAAALFRSKKLDADLDEELRAHIELAIEENRIPKSLSSSKSPCRLRAIPDCFYDRLFKIDKPDLSLSVQTSCFPASPASPAFKCRPSAWGQFGHSKSASGSMRSGLIGGCSSIAGVAFGTIFFLMGDPQPGQSCGFPVPRNFSSLIVGPTFAFMRSRPLLAGSDRSSQNHYSAADRDDSAIFRSDASSGCSELGYRPVSEWAALSQVNGRGRNR
jgi:hypothetical protein